LIIGIENDSDGYDVESPISYDSRKLKSASRLENFAIQEENVQLKQRVESLASALGSYATLKTEHNIVVMKLTNALALIEKQALIDREAYEARITALSVSAIIIYFIVESNVS
jgi:hypothetical protein